MRRILIIGCSCSGKSTLARALGSRLGLPVVHLDRLWWKRGWENVSIEEFDRRLSRALDQESWIIDGNYARTMDRRLEKCDTIIYLDFTRWQCLWGLAQRLIANLGKSRADMPAGCPERFDWDFVKWIWNFNKNNRAMNHTYIAKASHAKAIILKNRREVSAFLQSL